jgi:PAS domain S-box-containing protein
MSDKSPRDISAARATKLALANSPNGATVRDLLKSGNTEVFRRLIDSVHDYAIFLLTPDGHIASWNVGAARIKGYTAEEAIGKHFSIFYTDEALQRDWPSEELRRAAALGHIEDEGWRVRKDGTRFWANTLISPVHGNSGELLGFSKITRDLTERREQERRLAVSERNLRLLIELVQDYAIFQLDPTGVITSWNLGAQRIKGYLANEAIGRHFSMFYPPEAVASGWPAEELKRAAAAGRFEDEGWRLRKDGSRIWANVIITAIRDKDGTLLGFSKVTRDLTERRRHEEQLRQREENLRLLVDGVKDHAMFLLDPAGRILSWNEGAKRLLGYEAAAVIGMDASMLLPTEEAAAGKSKANLAASDIGDSVKVEGWVQKADGSKIWAETTTNHLRDPNGQNRGYIQIIRDLTDKQRVQFLEEEGRRMSEFIAMLSHELRNPLAPIRNAMSFMQKASSDPQVAWCIDIVGRQVAHMSRLVDDLLDVSRITTGKIHLESSPVELTTLVRMAVDASRAMVESRKQTLTLDLSRRPVCVLGDTTRLTQVVVNLLSNATKYTPSEGQIKVSVHDDGGFATIQVTDSGVGMSEQLLKHAFDPFVQGHRTLDRSDGGLGIGLTLVKKITELHGGTVTASSAGANRGSTITVTLPVCATEEEEAAAQALAAQASAVQPRRRRVLIVDDNRDAAESLAMVLRLYGHEVQAAYDGAQALNFAAATRPSTVLLDIGLPGMDGYEVARRLRELPGLTKVRLIAVTGYGQKGDREAAREAGFDLHVTKPVNPDDVEKLLT